MTQTFDAIVIGAGQAGPSLAGRLTAGGLTVAVIERHLFGGTCVNTGCTPTKTLIASARVAHQARRAAEYGVSIAGGVSVDLRAIKKRKDSIVAKSRSGIEQSLGGMKGCTVFHDHATFVGPHEVQVRDVRLASPRIFINVGGRAIIPPLPGIKHVPYLTNTSILDLDVLPRHLVVIGGSYIGLEFAQMFRRFGSEVTIVEQGPRLVSREDEDVSNAIAAVFENEEITIRTRAECIRFQMRGTDVSVGVNCASGPPEVVGSHVLLAVGRRPNTDDLGLDQAGVAVDDRGYIHVDEALRTNVPGIWALGDCNGRGAFTHTSFNDFEIVAANLLDGETRRVSDRIPCYGLFIDPPLGRVGFTEAEARAAGHTVRVGNRSMTRVSRAVEKGETQGFMKVIVDGASGEILGAAILGPGGDEAIHCVLDSMAAKPAGKASSETLRRAMHIHPTVAELIPTILGELRP